MFFGGFGGFWALFSDSLGFFTSVALGFVPKDPNWSGNGPKQNFQNILKTCLTSAQVCQGKIRHHDNPHLISDKTILSGGGTAYQDVEVIMGLIEVGYQIMHVGLIRGDLPGGK